jgi:hypothetical protein
MHQLEGGGKALLTRACIAAALGFLVVVASLGVMLGSPPEPPLVLREAPPLPTAAPAPGPVAVAPPPLAARSRLGRIVGAGREEVNLRGEPGTRGARLKGLSDGAELELLGHEVERNGRTWRDVRDLTDGAEGWVATEFLGPDR